MAFYELFDMAGGNQLGDYAAEAEALEDVRLTSERLGPAAVGSLALGYQDDEGHTRLIAEGRELLVRACPAPIV